MKPSPCTWMTQPWQTKAVANNFTKPLPIMWRFYSGTFSCQRNLASLRKVGGQVWPTWQILRCPWPYSTKCCHLSLRHWLPKMAKAPVVLSKALMPMPGSQVLLWQWQWHCTVFGCSNSMHSQYCHCLHGGFESPGTAWGRICLASMIQVQQSDADAYMAQQRTRRNMLSKWFGPQSVVFVWARSRWFSLLAACESLIRFLWEYSKQHGDLILFCFRSAWVIHDKLVQSCFGSMWGHFLWCLVCGLADWP